MTSTRKAQFVSGEWRSIDSAPRDGEAFWGKVDDDAIRMLWHEGFKEFVSSWRCMTLADGMTWDDTGLGRKDHHPVVHHPSHWMPLPAPPVSP